MLGLLKVAVTGGLSSGKSSVCRILKKLGADVVSADDIVHLLLSPKTKPGQQVMQLLGDDIVVNQLIDRSKIAKKVFKHPELLKALEKILHPAVLDNIQEEYRKKKESRTSTLFVAEIPLLFEANMESYFDKTIVVQAEPECCAKRFQASTNNSLEEYQLRASHQLPIGEKAKRADFVITNNGSFEDLELQVELIYNQINKT